jgi:hypothetical protein
VLAGRRGASLAAEVRSQAERAIARLERGLGDYAVKPRPGSKQPQGEFGRRVDEPPPDR